MQMESFTHDAYTEAYSEDENFKEVFQHLQSQIHVLDGANTIDYHIEDGLLSKLDKLLVPKGEPLQLVREAHTSKIARHLDVGKTMENMQRYVYWPKMQGQVGMFIRGCMIYCTNKPSNKKHRLYHPLLVPSRTWENISKDFVGRLPTTNK